MKKINTDSVVRGLKSAELKLRKNGPKIAVTAGCIGTVAAGVMACKDTLKLDSVLDEIKIDIDNVKGMKLEGSEKYKELTKVYAKSGLKIGKLYADSVITEAGSLILIGTGFGTMSKRERNAAAAVATYAGILSNYRKNVISELGEDADRRFRYGLKENEMEITPVDDDGKAGKKEKVTNITTNAMSDYSDFARFFDESCRGWDKDPEYNKMFLSGVESWCTNKLRRDGYLFLNQVYEALGMEPTYAGNSVGWIYDDENPVGDNRVIFNVYDPTNEAKRMFVNGQTNVVLIDFNIDGDLMHNPKLNERLEECFPSKFLDEFKGKLHGRRA